MASPEAYARVSMAMGTNQFLQADVDVFVLKTCRNLAGVGNCPILGILDITL